MVNTEFPEPAATDIGVLGVYQLKRLWHRALEARRGRQCRDLVEIHRDRIVRDALGLGLEQVQQHLLQTALTFEEFERWVQEVTGGVEGEQVARINAAIAGGPPSALTRGRLSEIEAMAPVLSAEDLAHWEEHGYVIVHDAVPEDTRRAAEAGIWEHLNARPEEPDTWRAPLAQGIMMSMFQHAAFTANRRSPRVHKAFAQFWGTADLWVTCDRGGFNPPLRAGEGFRATDLHWDVSLAQPVPFGTQGILYLTDTPPEQGAFRCVPGFHRRLEAWLDGLPAEADPRRENLHALGVKNIGGRAGDLIIWDHKLPHGASPNRGTRPRLVQYINMYPTRIEERAEWR